MSCITKHALKQGLGFRVTSSCRRGNVSVESGSEGCSYPLIAPPPPSYVHMGALLICRLKPC